MSFDAAGIVTVAGNGLSGLATSDIDLYLNPSGVEYIYNVRAKEWKQLEWKSINAPTGIGSVSAPASPAVSLYPKPARDVLYIKSEEAVYGLTFYDTKGQRVLQAIPTGNEIYIGALAAGLYTVKISTETGVTGQSVLKIK